MNLKEINTTSQEKWFGGIFVLKIKNGGKAKMKKEQLIEKGLSEEQVKAVLSLYTEEIKNFVPKTQFNELNTAKGQLEAQVADRDKQLKDLKAKVGDNEELKVRIEGMEKDNKAQREKYEAEIKDLKLDSAIRAKLADTKYPELLAGKIDRTKLTLNADGTVSGIDEQVTVLKGTYKDLFTPSVSGKAPGNNGNPTPSGNTGRAAELQKIIDDPQTSFVNRIAARNELYSLQAESEE